MKFEFDRDFKGVVVFQRATDELFTVDTYIGCVKPVAIYPIDPAVRVHCEVLPEPELERALSTCHVPTICNAFALPPPLPLRVLAIGLRVGVGQKVGAAARPIGTAFDAPTYPSEDVLAVQHSGQWSGGAREAVVKVSVKKNQVLQTRGSV